MSAGAAAAAAAQAAAQQEEEEMTPYASQDLAENWEFKILRSATGSFRDPVWLHGVLQEEGRAGWTIVEKFDDSRIRLKRLAKARASDATLGFDAYRTWVGTSQSRLTAYILIGVFGSLGLIGAIVAVIVALTQSAGHR